MCGLLGAAIHEDADFPVELAGHVLNQLQRANQARGGDSYGLGLIEPDEKQVRLYKTVGKISEHEVSAPAWRGGLTRFMRQVAARKRIVAIGHNRKATTGANTERNAHPFLVGRPQDEEFVVGAHNGMVSTWRGYKNEWNITRNIEVDSEVIFRGLYKYRDEADPHGTALGLLVPSATMALAYMTEFNKLRFFRGDNPLSIAHRPGVLFWSSSNRHLEDVVFGLDLKIQSFTKNKRYTFDLDTWEIRSHKVQENKKLFDKFWNLRTRVGKNYKSRSKKSTSRRQTMSRSPIVRDHGRPPSVREAYDNPMVCFRDTYPDSGAGTGSSTTTDDTEELPFPDSVGGEASTILYPVRESIEDYINDGLADDPDAQVEAKILVLPDQGQAHCEVCSNEHAEEDEIIRPWQLLWYAGQGYCPVCYYYLIQSDAETRIGQRDRKVGR